MSSEVCFNLIDGVGMLSINRPKALNALSKDIVNQIDSIVSTIATEKNIKVLIIISKDNFAAGADIKGMINCNPEEAKEFSFSETFNKIQDLKIPTIAAIDGYALGGGLELALTCDFRLATTTSKLGFPEINLGIMPGAGGTVRLPRLIGESKAKELIFLGETIKSDKAYELGLINKVVDNDKLEIVSLELANKLKSKAYVALTSAKESINYSCIQTDYKVAIDNEARIWSELFRTYDQKEGMNAFIEKRRPNYKDM